MHLSICCTMKRRRAHGALGLGTLALLLRVASPAFSQGFTSSQHILKRKLCQRRSIAPWRSHGNGHVQLTSTEEEELDNATSVRHRKGMSVALTGVYFTVMWAKCALPACLALLCSPTTGVVFPTNCIPQQLFARQLMISTLAVAVGKLVLGPCIDSYGGTLSLKVALIVLTGLLACISLSQSFMVFAVAWIFVDFVFSSCWASCINAIHQSFPQKEWAGMVAGLAAAARTGNAAAFAIFAYVLRFFETRMRQPWRPVFALSAAIQLVPILLLFRYGKEATVSPTTIAVSRSFSTRTTPQNNNLRLRRSLVTLRREATTPEFWCHLVSRAVLMVFASFLMFVPSLISQAYGASSAHASQVGSIYAIGCLLSVTFGSKPYARLRPKNKLFALMAMLGTATACSIAQLGHMQGSWVLTLNMSALSMFLWGAAFAIPFYIPPSLYALAKGGVESSATIADAFDVGGFALLAAFNGYVAGIAHHSRQAWIPAFQITTACSLISLAALSVASLREA
jgi:MFS family permease